MKPKIKITIKQRFFFFSALNIIGVVLAIAVISNVLFEKAILEKAKMFQQREVSLVASNIELLVNSIDDYMVTLSVDSNLQEVLKTYEDLPQTGEEQYNTKTKLMRAVYEKTALNSYIDSVAVISENGTFLDMGNYSKEVYSNLIEEKKIVLSDIPNKPLWYGPLQVKRQVMGEENVFVIAKQVRDIWSPELLGYVFAFVKESKVSEFYRNIINKNTELYVVNKDMDVISAADQEQLFKNEKDMEIYQNSRAEFVKTTEQISINDWQVIDLVPKEYLVSEMDKINISMLNIGFAAILAAFFMSYVIASKLTKPIQNLAMAMKAFDYQSFDCHTQEVSSPVELNLLTRRFNQMVDRIGELMKQIKIENEEKREVEFRLIQSQIKPHFLYNSLETIIALIGISMNEQAMQYTKSLGSFYRVSLSNGSDMITLREETRLIQDYLYMQGIRYVDRMQYKIEVLEEVMDSMIPKLTLQPIVENAIYHGIKPKKEKCLICIGFCQEGGDVLITVRDNGIGIKQEEIDNLLVPEEQKEEGGFGLKAIHNRLKLVFGENYGITIRSSLGEYTEVTVRIPEKGGARSC